MIRIVRLANNILFVLTLLCAGCFMHAGEKSTVQKGEARKDGFQFRWKAPREFLVEETIEKQGSKMTLLHTMSVVETNRQFIVRWLACEPLTLNGEKIIDAETKQSMASVVALFVALPPLRISTNGGFLGIQNAPESIAATSRNLDRLYPERTEEQRQQFRNMMTNSVTLKVYGQILSQYWNTWVENWIGLNLTAGTTFQPEKGKANVVGGMRVPANVVIRNLGAVKENTNQVHLRYEETTDGPQFAKALASEMHNVEKSQGKPKSKTPAPKSASRAVVMEVRTDPATLMPSWAKREIDTTVEFPGEAARTGKESSEYRFYWGDSILK